MTNRTTDHLTLEQFVATMTERMEHIAQTLSTWAQEAPRSLSARQRHRARGGGAGGWGALDLEYRRATVPTGDADCGLVARQSVCLACGNGLAWADTPERTMWARAQLDSLWAGQIDTVLAALQPHAGTQAIDDAITYDTTHRERMDYSAYRERGLHVGSGTIESGCKQLVSARLKIAGMIWDTDGAEAVAVVRAWLKSDRWNEAMQVRLPLRRTYQRKVPEAEAVAAAA
jgi:hypothetical protein